MDRPQALKKAANVDARYKRANKDRQLLLETVKCYQEADARLTEAITSPQARTNRCFISYLVCNYCELNGAALYLRCADTREGP